MCTANKSYKTLYEESGWFYLSDFSLNNSLRQTIGKEKVSLSLQQKVHVHWLHATPVARTGANSIIYFQKVKMELIRIHFFINSQLFNTQIRKIRVVTLWVFIVWVVRKREGSFLGIAVKLRWFWSLSRRLLQYADCYKVIYFPCTSRGAFFLSFLLFVK